MASSQDHHSELSTPPVGDSAGYGQQQATPQQDQLPCSCSLHHHHQHNFHPHASSHHHHHPQLHHHCDSASGLQDAIIHPYGCSGAPSLISATPGATCDCPADIQSACMHQEPTSGRSSRIMSADENNPSGSEDSGRKCSTRAT